MREVEIGTKLCTTVYAMDKPMEGNHANHRYHVEFTSVAPQEPGSATMKEIPAVINFQRGPVKEAGKNGIHNEDLLAIVIDRLRGFQGGSFKCRENAIAITKLEEALHWLNNRTAERRRRGVEGTNEL